MVHGTLTREAMHEPSLRETRRGASQGDDRSGRYTLVRIRPRDEYSSSTMNLPAEHQAPPSSAATPKIPHQSAPAPLAMQYFTERSTSPALTRARRPARLLSHPAAQMIASSNVDRGASAGGAAITNAHPDGGAGERKVGNQRARRRAAVVARATLAPHTTLEPHAPAVRSVSRPRNRGGMRGSGRSARLISCPSLGRSSSGPVCARPL